MEYRGLPREQPGRCRCAGSTQAAEAKRPPPWRPFSSHLAGSSCASPPTRESPAGAEPEAAAALLARDRREVVITRGGDGATVTTAGGTVSAPARRVPVKDVIGAGDAFVAGYLSALLDGLRVEERLHRVITTGAFAVTTRGDWEGPPTRADLVRLDSPTGTTLR
ncbi:carbohydrate kinase family protein [Streptomyces sp. NPDC050422]|uniref:carbohydrate kinase family protein n=1 Tax=Streptomyces sp. NPDC050422 TaxID=3365614 RepID=UPI0037997304